MAKRMNTGPSPSNPDIPTQARAVTFGARQLEIFQAIYRAGGVSSAARLLGMSQPAVSYLLASLERSLDVKLFNRERGRLRPTREGVSLATEVERHFVGLETIARMAATLRDQEAGQLNIGVLPALGYTLFPRVVAKFRERYPRTRVSMQTLSSNAIKDGVTSGRFDLGVVACEIDTHGVRHSTFASRNAVLAVPRNHRLAGRRSVQPRDLRDEPFVALNPEDAIRRPVDAAMSEAKVALSIVAETPYAIGVCALVAAGVGIGLVNPLSVPASIRTELKLLEFKPAIRFEHLLILPPFSSLRDAAQSFLSLARAEVAASETA